MRLAVLLFVPALLFGQAVPKNINATVKKIVERCRGYVQINSFVGKGTACRVYLPAIDAAQIAS